MNDPFKAYSLSQRLKNIAAEIHSDELKHIANILRELEQENAALRTEIFYLKNKETA